MKRLTNYFLQGLLFLVPLVITVYVFYFLFQKIDSLLRIPIPGVGIIPGVGFVATILIVILIGFLVSNFLTRRIMLTLDNLFNRLPLIKLLYGSIKDLLNAFVGNKKVSASRCWSSFQQTAMPMFWALLPVMPWITWAWMTWYRSMYLNPIILRGSCCCSPAIR